MAIAAKDVKINNNRKKYGVEVYTVVVSKRAKRLETKVAQNRFQFKCFKPVWLLMLLGGLGTMSFSHAAHSQQAKTQRIKGDTALGSENETTAILNSLEKRLEEQDRKIEAQDKESQKQKELIEAQKAEIENIRTRQNNAEENLGAQGEDLELKRMMEEEEQRQRLRIYGFSDFRFYKMWVNEDSEMAPFFNGKSSFGMANFNLFLDHRLTDSFRYMAEIRFSTLPQGVLQVSGMEITRKDNSVLDPSSNKLVRFGSIIIERAFLEYTPMDYINVRIGRFLTPFGIWNQDHGTPVIIPAHTPTTLMIGLLPEAQTGIHIYGRAFPIPELRLDYALTLSNGRGPVDEILDLDENKGIGARLRVGWDGEFKLFLGAYLYMGDYTDTKFQVQSVSPIRTEEEKTEWYSEKAASVDLLFEYRGFRLQGEYVINSRVYHDQKRGAHIFSQAALPDYYSYGLYILAAYQLPLDTIDIRPYMMFDRFIYYDFSEGLRQNVSTLGVNWRINPFVVYKVEYYMIVDGHEITLHGLNTQLAVSF